MSQDINPEEQAFESAQELKEANERRLDALLKINNRYVRTQRHLEQHSDITNLDNLKHSLKVQEERETQMNNLKSIIAYGEHEEVNDRENTKRHIEFTNHYLQHHASRMDEFSLQKTMEKQEHRKDQLNSME